MLTLDYLHQKQPGVVQDIRLQDLLLTVRLYPQRMALQRDRSAGLCSIAEQRCCSGLQCSLQPYDSGLEAAMQMCDAQHLMPLQQVLACKSLCNLRLHVAPQLALLTKGRLGTSRACCSCTGIVVLPPIGQRPCQTPCGPCSCLQEAVDNTGSKLPRPLLKVSMFKLSKYQSDRTEPIRGLVSGCCTRNISMDHMCLPLEQPPACCLQSWLSE